MIFNIDENGFELKGKIDHSDGGRPSSSDYWGGYSYYDNNVKRILHIDDVLYTFSNQSLRMNKINNLDDVNTLDFIDEFSDIEIINKDTGDGIPGSRSNPLPMPMPFEDF